MMSAPFAVAAPWNICSTLERGHDRALGDMLGRAADLIAFERLGIVDGDGDAAVIRGEVAQRRVTHRRRRACRRPSRP